MYQSNFFSSIRKILRYMGLTKTIGRLIAKKDYEALFQEALLSKIQIYDNVFDIGANWGFYTRKFLEIATKGNVLAFEPIPENCNEIEKLKNEFSQLIIFQKAVGSKPDRLPMSVGKDSMRATSTIKKEATTTDIMVDVLTIDHLVNKDGISPNVIKIDVEGFELEVLKGMIVTLRNENLRIIGIELHFNSMEKLGYKNGPKQIVEILHKSQFSLKWIDHSHIVAYRKKLTSK